MLSTCPSCLSQVLHDDSLSKVKCECGEHFSPFLSVESPESNLDLDSLRHSPNSVAMSQKVQLQVPAKEPESPPELVDYSESESVFADIRRFGESLDGEAAPEAGGLPSTGMESAPASDSPHPSQNTDSQTKTPANTPAPFAASAQLMTSGDSIPGFSVSGFLAPISVWCQASATDEDPLQSAFQNLWNKAIHLGANGVIGIHWSFTPDGNRILVSGTPVQCQKNT